MDTTANQTLTGAYYDGVRQTMQISRDLHALHPFISPLPAPPAEHGRCKPPLGHTHHMPLIWHRRLA